MGGRIQATGAPHAADQPDLSMQIIAPFTTTKILLAAGVLLLAPSLSLAQQIAIGLPGQRVLGERTFDAAAGVVDIDEVDERGYALGFGVNLPAMANLDLGFHYGYGWVDENGIRLEDSTLSTAAVLHGTGEGLKPFAAVLAGYQKMELKVGPFHASDSSGVWGAGAGIEIPVGRGTITPSVTFTDSFDGSTDRTVHFTLHANYWFTPKFAGYAEVTHSDIDGLGDSAWTHRLGVRFRF